VESAWCLLCTWDITVILKYHARHRFLHLEDLNSSEKYNTNLKMFMSNYDEIKNQHRGEFIAIFDGDIVGDTSREALLERIREKVEDKDIDSVFQTYISKTDDIIW
jgi:RNA binding exosome subunit